METEYIDPNELSAKFRSKYDLWKRLSVDGKYLLVSLLCSQLIPSLLQKMSRRLHEKYFVRKEKVRLS